MLTIIYVFSEKFVLILTDLGEQAMLKVIPVKRVYVNEVGLYSFLF